MMKTCHLWTLVFVIVKASGCFTSSIIGTLYPRDSNYMVGTDVTLRCVLNETAYLSGNIVHYKFNSSFITFKFGNEYLKSEITLPNDREAVTVIKNGQLKDSGRYFCYLELINKTVLLCPSDIKFAYPPENVTNFKCRSYNWQNLTCAWSAPRNPAVVTYKLYYKPSHFMDLPPFMCQDYVNTTACSYTKSSTPLYIPVVPNLTVSIIGSNGLGNDSEQIFKYNHWSIVIPGKPESLKVVDVTATLLHVAWKNPAMLKPGDFPPGVCYRVTYYSSYEEKNVTVYDTGVNESNITLTGLNPNTWYNVFVKARSCAANADLEEDLWSPDNSIQWMTEPDIPWSSPEVQESFFDVVNSNSSRTVTVYWKHVDSREENGDNFHYEVSIAETFLGNYKRRETKELQRIPVFKDNIKRFHNLDMESAYQVWIWSVNSVGSSLDASRIVIPKHSRMPPRPLHIRPVSEGGGQYNVSWAPSSENVKAYTLIWCQGGQRCKFGIKWITVSAKNNSVLLNLDDNKNYGFGVAAISSENGFSSGLEWAPCTAYRNRALSSMTGLKADYIKSHSITVSWKLACEVQKAIVSRYLVLICEMQCQSCSKECLCTEKRNVIVSDPEAESVVIEKLSPYTSYGYNIVAYSETGGSPESFLHCVTTLADAPSDPPYGIKHTKITNTSTTLSWEPPVNPNGVIDRYVVRYKKMVRKYNRQIEDLSDNVPVSPEDSKTTYKYPLEGLSCFTEYSVMISACVGSKCSNYSSPLYIKTKIGVPGIMDPPRTEVVNSSHVRVIWKAPEHPNGPVDCYLLHLYKREMDNVTILNLVNVTGTSVELPRDCSPEVQTMGEGIHLFSVQAVNLVPGQGFLYGPISNNTETRLCLMGPDMNSALVIGIIIGSTLALAIVILSLYSVVRWMKAKVDKMKNIKVVLPDGLQQPYSNSYENFKNGLSKQGSESNLSPKLGYGRMDSFNGDNNNSDDSFKNRHGSGASHHSASSTDELINKPNQPGQGGTTPKSMSTPGHKTMSRGDPNHGGDNSSGHDSISSSLTHRTNLSTDGSSSNEEPRDKQTSRDSGLDEENKTNKVPPGSSSMASSHYLPIAPYSKLGFLEGGRHGDYLPLARGRHLSLYGHNLANSEPSITDLSPDSCTSEQCFLQDPPSPDVPYSKFGMSHSVTDLILEGMELPESPLSSNPSPNEALPYSRFGLRRVPPSNPYVTMGMALVSGPQKDPNQLLAPKVGPLPLILKSPSKKKAISEKPAEMVTVPDEAYSKLGLSAYVAQTKFQPYLTMKEIKENEQIHLLPDLTISNREGNLSQKETDNKAQKEEASRSGYLPHQLIPAIIRAPEPPLPDLVNCGNNLPLAVDSREMPGVKIQEGSGYITLNQVLGSNANA